MSFLFDTHIHTSQSSPCGKVDARDVAKYYMESDYNGIVVTDHLSKIVMDMYPETSWQDRVTHYLSGYKTVCETAKGSSLTVLMGIELRFTDHPNDYLVYGITEEDLYRNENLYAMTLPQFYELARREGWMVYQAHPYRDGITPASPEFLDGIEVYNAHPRHDSRNHKALAYAEKYDLRQLSGSDVHQQPDYGRGGVYLPVCPATSMEFAALLRENRIEGLKRAE